MTGVRWRRVVRRLGPQRLAAVGLALAMAAACGAGEPQAAPVETTTAPPPLRVMTWNLQRGQAMTGPLAPADMVPYATRVTANRADVVGLQEVTFEQATALARVLGWGSPGYVETKKPCPDLPPPLPAACVPFGNALLSRHPLGQTEHWPLPAASLEAALEERVLLRSVVDVGGVHHFVYVTHLAANATRAEREAQVEAVLALVDGDRSRAGEPFRPILLGDLNAGPESDVVALMTEQFVDAWAEAGDGGPGFTSDPTRILDRRFDYVLVGRSSGLRPTEVSVDPEVLSDHLPVLAELT